MLWKVRDGSTSIVEARAEEGDPVGACQPEREISSYRRLPAVSQARAELPVEASWARDGNPLAQTIAAKEDAAFPRKARREAGHIKFLRTLPITENRFRQAFALTKASKQSLYRHDTQRHGRSRRVAQVTAIIPNQSFVYN